MEARFAEPSVLILASLSSGPKHGYALIKDIEEIAGTTLGPGTLYGALSRLVQRGLVEALPAQDRRRRPTVEYWSVSIWDRPQVFRGGWPGAPADLPADILVPLTAHAGKEPCHARLDLLDVRRPVRRHRTVAAALPDL